MADILKHLKSIRPASWLKALIYALLIAFTYQTALKQMIFHDWAREDYSHCYLIPFVVLYLLWEKRAALASIPSSPSWAGFIPFGFGIGLFWLGELGGEYFTIYISLWLVILGLAWLHLGWMKLKEIGFAFLMMLTMYPFPSFINNKILLNLKLISSQLGVRMLHLYGMSAYREGNVIDLGFTQLQVVDACSGLRYVYPLVVLSLLLAYWFKAAFWKKALLVLSAIPLSIVVNSFRIAMTGILYSSWGAKVAEEFFHGFSGWLIFIFTLPVLLLEMWVLKKIGSGVPGSRDRVPGVRDQGAGARDQKPETRNQKPETRDKRSLVQPVFVAAMLVLISTFALSRGIEFREKVPIKKSFAEFPLTIGEWAGTRQEMEQKYIEQLHFSEYIMVGYRNPKGHDIDFYVAYYENQRKGESTHSPETCLPGGGWTFEQSGAASVVIDGNKRMRVNRAFMEKSGYRQLTYFWFPQRGRILTSLWQVKLYSFWDALTRRRTDGALVRIITPVYGNEEIKDTEARIQEFTKQIVPVLDGFLPK